MRNVMISAALVLAASAAVATAAVPDADGWQIGPVIRGKNYSVGMPSIPTDARQGWYFDFPYPSPSAGHVHALTFNHGPLTGKSRIVMRYRIDAERGVRIMPREAPGNPATITMFFQRRGDSWNAKGRYEAYRWYAPTVVDITPGVHEVSVSFRDNWAAVMNSTARTNPVGFREAIDDADRVGFVLGARVGGAGHGVFATGPARMTVLSFQVL
ncbi:MAG: hypothetical protein H0W74_07575 [Sphingosinicella sp.]|nr:hypothetical protein [Sphingosinicella sp.]